MFAVLAAFLGMQLPALAAEPVSVSISPVSPGTNDAHQMPPDGFGYEIAYSCPGCTGTQITVPSVRRAV